MIDKVGVVALLLAVALSGCTSDEGEPALTAADCEAQGLVLKEAESHDHGGEEEHHEASCVEASEMGPRGSVDLGGLPTSLPMYQSVPLTWTLGTTLPGEDHAMRTEIRYSSEPLPEGNVKPDDWGLSVAKFEHQNYENGATYDATFTAETEGTFYFHAYSLVGGENIWSPQYLLEITPVVPTGVVHEIAVDGLGPQASIEKSSLDIMVGDSIKFTNSDLLERSFTAANGEFDFTVAGQGGSSDELTILSPGTINYDSATALSPLGDLSGSIQVKTA